MGLQDWVACDEDDYVARAMRHATDAHALARLRSDLRQQVAASPLFDAARFTQSLQSAIHGMWLRQGFRFWNEDAPYTQTRLSARAADHH